MANNSAMINTAVTAAFSAASVIQKSSQNIAKIKVTQKGKNDFVTEIDKLAETAIIQSIQKVYPKHNILSEECGLIDNKSDVTWIVDPLDGTTNFMHNNPQYAISIGVKHEDKLTHGVILDPNRNDLYVAESGKGAFCNNSRIRVSTQAKLEHSLIATGFPTYNQDNLDQYLAILKNMLLKTSGQRRAGSAALDLAYVARGAVDGFWEFNLKPWDIAAGIVLVKEAGGLVCDFAGEHNMLETGNILASTPKLLSALIKIIQQKE